MIDTGATKEVIFARGYSLRGFARANKLDVGKFPSYFYNNIKMPDEVAEILRAKDLLVERD